MSETVVEYWERKQRELELFARAARVEPARVATAAELVREKQRLRAALHARFIADHPSLTESNLTGAPQGRFRYSYQRFDLKISMPRFFEAVYQRAPGGHAFGLWGASGMSVISAVLNAIDQSLKSPRRLLVADDVYFETRKVLPLLEKILGQTDEDELRPGDFLWIDSVTAENRFDRFAGVSLAPLQALFFDTTCYDAGAPEIARVIDKCAAERVPLVMLRSHMKLDCLASEYARLGSLVVMLPLRPSKIVVKWARALRIDVLEQLALWGAMTTPAALFPLAADEEFRALNRTRNQVAARAQARAGAALPSLVAPTGMTLPHHGCFVVLRPLLDERERVIAHGRRLAARLQEAGIEARVAASFGYDIPAIAVMHGPRGSSVRLSIPDLPDEVVDRLVEVAGEEAASWLPSSAL